MSTIGLMLLSNCMKTTTGNLQELQNKYEKGGQITSIHNQIGFVLFCQHLLTRSDWTKSEDKFILQTILEQGKKWSWISKQLEGRTENQVKNRFKSLMLNLKDQIKDEEDELREIMNMLEKFNNENSKCQELPQVNIKRSKRQQKQQKIEVKIEEEVKQQQTVQEKKNDERNQQPQFIQMMNLQNAWNQNFLQFQCQQNLQNWGIHQQFYQPIANSQRSYNQIRNTVMINPYYNPQQFFQRGYSLMSNYILLLFISQIPSITLKHVTIINKTVNLKQITSRHSKIKIIPTHDKFFSKYI